MNELPDFIIIGAMKSATSTLYDQLVNQPGIFMTIPKEPNFFSDDAQFSKGLNWYTSLFENSEQGDCLGEASTHYTKLPDYPNTIKRMQQNNLHPKLIYVMRHPVDRLVSHYMHEFSQGVITSDINTAINEHKPLIQYSQYAMQLKPFVDEFGKPSILPVFFDSLRLNSQEELERICTFIGYKKNPIWKTEIAPSNVSSKRIKKFPLYNLIINSPVATFLRRIFIPKAIRNRVKKSLTQQKRPELNSENLLKIEKILNEDLKFLSDWLGVEINCKNFKEVTSNNLLDWKI